MSPLPECSDKQVKMQRVRACAASLPPKCRHRYCHPRLSAEAGAASVTASTIRLRVMARGNVTAHFTVTSPVEGSESRSASHLRCELVHAGYRAE